MASMSIFDGELPNAPPSPNQPDDSELEKHRLEVIVIGSTTFLVIGGSQNEDSLRLRLTKAQATEIANGLLDELR